MNMTDKYNPREIEGKWYDYWIDNKLFHSTPDEREPYTIVIPPPNVTGIRYKAGSITVYFFSTGL